MLKAFLTAGRERAAYDDAAARSGMHPGGVRTAEHRPHKRYKALLRAEIAQTVAAPAEVENEICALFASVRAM